MCGQKLTWIHLVVQAVLHDTITCITDAHMTACVALPCMPTGVPELQAAGTAAQLQTGLRLGACLACWDVMVLQQHNRHAKSWFEADTCLLFMP